MESENEKIPMLDNLLVENLTHEIIIYNSDEEKF